MAETNVKPPAGASVWEERMHQYLVEHMAHEGAILEQYVAAADQSPSKALTFLVNIVVEDEHRHHRWFNELLSSLRSQAVLADEDLAIPLVDLHRSGPEMVRVTEELIANEERDASELKQLRKEMKDLEGNSLWPLVIDLMQRDTEKHLALLHFAHKRMK
jgi:hypothetical protein